MNYTTAEFYPFLWMELPDGEKGAVLSGGGLYRYLLWRRWGEGGFCTFVMLNPSTADAHDDDPTIRRCVNFAKSWGYGGLMVVNLFAYRSTDPSVLPRIGQAMVSGYLNEEFLEYALYHSEFRVAAWGGKVPQGWAPLFYRDTVRFNYPLFSLGRNKDGSPKHPLYVKGDTVPVPWSIPHG